MTDTDRQGTCPVCQRTFDRFPNSNFKRPKKYCSKACYNAQRAARIEANCLTCGKDFWYYASWPLKYCSKACYEATRSHRRTKTTCPTCGKEFEYHLSWPRKYCSHACAGQVNIKNLGDITPNTYMTNCEQCGESFKVKPTSTRGRFCSHRCYGDWQSQHQRGTAHPTYGRKYGRAKHLPPPTVKQCEQCGQDFIIKPSHKSWRRFCSLHCRNMHLTTAVAGERNHNWRGGYLPYYGPSWRQSRRVVRDRDQVCADCGISPGQLGRALDVHHIKPFREFGVEQHEAANDPANLVALCPTCHMRREHSNSVVDR